MLFLLVGGVAVPGVVVAAVVLVVVVAGVVFLAAVAAVAFLAWRARPCVDSQFSSASLGRCSRFSSRSVPV